MTAKTLAWGTDDGTLYPRAAPFLESNSGSTTGYGSSGCLISFATGPEAGVVVFSYSYTGPNEWSFSPVGDGTYIWGGPTYVDGGVVSTTEISATVDGVPCTNTLTLTHAIINSYDGILTWGSVSSGGPPPKFWANLQGVTEP